MNVFDEADFRKSEYNTRRQFVKNCISGAGALTLGSMLGGNLFANNLLEQDYEKHERTHFAPKAKHVIYLHMAGAPSQLEMFDHKPELNKLNGQACPASLLEGKRFAFIR